ncbi:MAG: adenylate/guanylate cyclase domain-containing protein [Alphaproteobacteria bacterium]|nr:adenylate/guanylate cyclase domain-containing protein [Alphaproteobacteria bacterium]
MPGLLQDAAADAGVITHRVRMTFLVLVFLRLLVYAGDEMLAGVFKHWLTVGFMVGGMVASVAIVRAQARAADRQPWLLAGVLLDATLATLIILPSVLWPREAHLGVLRAPDLLIFPIVAIGAGIRMSRQVAVVGGLGSMAGIAALVALDLTRNGAVVRYGPSEILLTTVLMVGAILLSVGLVVFVQGLLARVEREARRAQQLRDRFGAYVAEELADILLAPGRLEPRRCEVAVLFSDLRGFTSYSQATAPDALVDELNAYFEAVVSAVRAERGVVDKYIGDAVMAVFGLPESHGDEACRAIRAAVAMQAALERHNAVRAEHGLPPLAQGVGVHFGEVVAGPVGTADRVQFTVLGDTVNVAARLEAATKTTGASVLISGAAVEKARQEGGALPDLVEGEALELRGREGRLPTFRA